MITTSELARNAATDKAAGPVAAWAASPDRDDAAGFTSILACVDGSPLSADVIEWAASLAQRTGASMRTLRVLETAGGTPGPHDPMDWELRRMDAHRQIRALLEHAGITEPEQSGVEVEVGPFHDRFQAFVAGTGVDLCVIGAVGTAASPDRLIGETARRIIETTTCSVLIVPPRTVSDAGREGRGPRRMMVPLDCSRRAETALPSAIALADAFGAEIVMAHAVPEPVLTEVGPPDPTGLDLRRTCAEHNRRAAARYMSRLRAQLSLDRRPVRTLILGGSDPRHQLVQAAASEAADLIVLTAKGAGGFADQALGSVAAFLVAHLSRPLLIVRPQAGASVTARTSATRADEGVLRIRT